MPLRIVLGRTGQSWEAVLLADSAADVSSSHTLVDLLVAAEVRTPDLLVVGEDFPRLIEGLPQLRRLARVLVVGTAPWADCPPEEVSWGSLGEHARSTTRGRLVAVWGPQGSWGVTSMAIGLARALCGQGSTLLVDANVHVPDVADLLDLPGGGLLQACLAADRGGVELPTRARGPLQVLTGVEPRMYPSVHAGALHQVLRTALGVAEWVVADTDSAVDAAGELGLVPDWTTATGVVLQAADEVVIVIGESDLAQRRLWRVLPAVVEIMTGRATVVINGCRNPRETTRSLAARLGDYVPEAAVGWISDGITAKSLAPIVAEVTRPVPAGAG